MHTKNYILALITVAICLSLNDSVFGEENMNSQRPKIYEIDGSEREISDTEIFVMKQSPNVFQARSGEDSNEFIPRNRNVRQARAGTSSGYGFSDEYVDQTIAGEEVDEDLNEKRTNSAEVEGCRPPDESLSPQHDEAIKNLAKGMDEILKRVKKSLSEDDENKNLLLEEMNIIRNLLEKNLDEDPNNDIHLTTLSRLIERFKKLESENFVELKKNSEPNSRKGSGNRFFGPLEGV